MLKKLNDTICVDTECCQAFNEYAIGSKVLNVEDFLSHLEYAIKTHDFGEDRVPGQGFLFLPNTCFEHVSAGDGERTDYSLDYVARWHRGRVDAYLKRERAGRVIFLATVVYTKEAYISDPEVDEVDETLPPGTEHVVVAVIAASAPEAPLTPHRLVSNLAGGNKEALKWSADEIRAKARASKDYWDKYCVVAD